MTMMCTKGCAQHNEELHARQEAVTLPFSEDVKPVYVLGSAVPGPETAASARKSLVTMAVG